VIIAGVDSPNSASRTEDRHNQLACSSRRTDSAEQIWRVSTCDNGVYLSERKPSLEQDLNPNQEIVEPGAHGVCCGKPRQRIHGTSAACLPDRHAWHRARTRPPGFSGLVLDISPGGEDFLDSSVSRVSPCPCPASSSAVFTIQRCVDKHVHLIS